MIKGVGSVVADEQVQAPVVIEVAPHAAGAAVGIVHAQVVRQIDPQPHARILRILAVVSQQAVGLIVEVRQVDVGIAVAVDVGPGAGHGVAVVADTGAVQGRHVGEDPLAGNRRVLAVVAVETVLAAVAEVEIHVTVLVEIAPGTAAAAAGIVDAGLDADIREHAAAVVAIQVVGGVVVGIDLHVDHVEIEVAVTVEIGPGHALTILVVGEGRRGDVWEEPAVGVARVLAVVAEEVVGGIGPALVGNAVGDVEIVVAVAVVVAPGGAAAVAVVADSRAVVR